MKPKRKKNQVKLYGEFIFETLTIWQYLFKINANMI